MSRIYLVRDGSGQIVRYVRAKTRAGAIAAHASGLFGARPATAEEIFTASKSGELQLLDATEQPGERPAHNSRQPL